MRAQITRLTAAVMVIGLALGAGGSASAAATAVPGFERPETGGGVVSVRTTLVQLDSDGRATQRYGHLVGRFFVGVEEE